MLRSEEGTKKHKCKGTKIDEGQSGTIYNANNGTSNANSCTYNKTYYKNTIDGISIGKTTEGLKARGTINDISIGEIVEGAKIKS